MKKEEKKVRKEVLEAAQRLNPSGLNVNKSGNVSARYKDGFIVTPSGIPYDELTIDSLSLVRKEGSGYEFEGPFEPSSEWELHAMVYEERPDLNAIVHTHSLYGTVLACLGEGIPPFHYMVAVAGGTEIPCAKYALFGTKQLAVECAKALRTVDACLLDHHGVVACGRTVKKAFALAAEVENLAHMWVEARKLNPNCLLSEEQMLDVTDRFQTYGQHRK